MRNNLKPLYTMDRISGCILHVKINFLINPVNSLRRKWQGIPQSKPWELLIFLNSLNYIPSNLARIIPLQGYTVYGRTSTLGQCMESAEQSLSIFKSRFNIVSSGKEHLTLNWKEQMLCLFLSKKVQETTILSNLKDIIIY